MDFYDVHGEPFLVDNDWPTFLKKNKLFSHEDRRIAYTKAQRIDAPGIVELSTVFMWGHSLGNFDGRIYVCETAVKKYGFDFEPINCNWTVISRYCSWEEASNNHMLLCQNMFELAAMITLKDIRNPCPLCGLKEKKEITIET